MKDAALPRKDGESFTRIKSNFCTVIQEWKNPHTLSVGKKNFPWCIIFQYNPFFYVTHNLIQQRCMHQWNKETKNCMRIITI